MESASTMMTMWCLCFLIFVYLYYLIFYDMLMFMVIKCYFKSCMRANLLNSPSKAFSCYTLSCSSPACPSIHLQAQPLCSLPLTSAHIFPPTSLFSFPSLLPVPFLLSLSQTYLLQTTCPTLCPVVSDCSVVKGGVVIIFISRGCCIRKWNCEIQSTQYREWLAQKPAAHFPHLIMDCLA